MKILNWLLVFSMILFICTTVLPDILNTLLINDWYTVNDSSTIIGFLHNYSAITAVICLIMSLVATMFKSNQKGLLNKFCYSVVYFEEELMNSLKSKS